jgi:hypothetical protein
VEALVGQPRDDLLLAEERVRAREEVRQRQLEVHHQAVQGNSFVRGDLQTLSRFSRL